MEYNVGNTENILKFLEILFFFPEKRNSLTNMTSHFKRKKKTSQNATQQNLTAYICLCPIRLTKVQNTDVSGCQ